MKRSLVCILLLAIAAPVTAQVLTYEKTFALFAGGDRRLTVTIDANGEMSIHRPAVMTRAGDYHALVPTSTYAELAVELSVLSAYTPMLQTRVGQRTAAELYVVTDQDLTIIRVRDPAMGKVVEIRFPALEAWARHYPDDVELQRMADLEQRIWALMDQHMREAGHE
jgi:hypothetical protein